LPSFFLPRSTEARGESLDASADFSVPALDAAGVDGRWVVDGRAVSSLGFGALGSAGVTEGSLVASGALVPTLSSLGRSVEAGGSSLGASAATSGASGTDGRAVSSLGFGSPGTSGSLATSGLLVASVASAIVQTLSFTNLYSQAQVSES